MDAEVLQGKHLKTDIYTLIHIGKLKKGKGGSATVIKVMVVRFGQFASANQGQRISGD